MKALLAALLLALAPPAWFEALPALDQSDLRTLGAALGMDPWAVTGADGTLTPRAVEAIEADPDLALVLSGASGGDAPAVMALRRVQARAGAE